MKINKFLVATIASAAMLTSCSKSNDPTESNSENGIKAKTYASFHITSDGGSRAGAVAETDNGDVESASDIQKIGDVRMLIFNASTKALEINRIVDLNAGKVTVLVTPGTKKMFFIANVADKATLNGKLENTAGNLQEGVATLDNLYAITIDATGTPGTDAAPSSDFSLDPLKTKSASVGFPLSSSDNFEYTFAPNVTQAQAEAAAPAPAGSQLHNAFKVSLSYMLSKAAVYKAAGMTVIDGTVENMTFAVRNIAQKTNLVQQYVGTETKSYYHTMFGETTPQSEFNTHFDYSAAPSVAVAENIAGISDAAGKYVYVSENTNAFLRKGQASYVAINANFIPANVKIETQIEWSEVNPVGSRLITGTGVSGTANTTFVVMKRTIGSELVVGTRFATEAAAQKAIALVMSNGVSTAYAGTPADDYTVYTDGTCWYRVNIGNGTGTSTKYGVIRGNKYQIAINAITGPGASTESALAGEGVGPGDPLEVQTYISATLEVKNWTPVAQGVSL